MRFVVDKKWIRFASHPETFSPYVVYECYCSFANFKSWESKNTVEKNPFYGVQYLFWVWNLNGVIAYFS